MTLTYFLQLLFNTTYEKKKFIMFRNFDTKNVIFIDFTDYTYLYLQQIKKRSLNTNNYLLSHSCKKDLNA